MRDFNKLHVISLPRCATVSLCDALALLGIHLSHLGKMQGDESEVHYDAPRLIRIHEQITRRDYKLDILQECAGLADYPACIAEVFEALDQQYPGSLFINVRRDWDVESWLQSAEKQFVGLQLLKTGRGASVEDQAFMRAMTDFRRMTFGKSDFDARLFGRAYERHQREVERYFSGKKNMLLEIPDLRLLPTVGFQLVCEFLECPIPTEPFPFHRSHSDAPQQAFAAALRRGEIVSQTGICPDGEVPQVSVP